jgi:hypothetical protein
MDDERCVMGDDEWTMDDIFWVEVLYSLEFHEVKFKKQIRNADLRP